MNIYKKRIFGLIWAFLYVGIYLGISVIIQNVYIVWLAASGLSQNEILEKTLGATFALSVISSMISVWAYILIGKVRKKPINTVIKNKPVTAATVGMSALCAVGARMIVSAYLYIAQSIEPLKKSIDDAAEFSPALESAGQLFAAATAQSSRLCSEIRAVLSMIWIRALRSTVATAGFLSAGAFKISAFLTASIYFLSSSGRLSGG